MQVDLRQAADVAGDQQISTAGQHVARLLLPQPRGQLRLLNVVRPRGSAAQLAVRYLHQRQVGDAAQQVARLRTDALRVGQMAGIVVGHSHWLGQRRWFLDQAKLRQEDADVHCLGRKADRRILVRGALEKQRVFVHA